MAGSTFSWPYLAAFFALWAATHVLIIVLGTPEVLGGAQIDTDAYLRLVRVRLLLDNGAWFDGSIPRSNWPFGEDHHWTRPLDVLIILLAAPFLFLGIDAAVAISGALISPLIHLGACLVIVWAVRPLVPGPERFLAMAALLIQPGVLGYGTAGRADHHILIFLLFAASVGAWIRVLLMPNERGPAFLAALLSGIALWVSPESLVPLSIVFLSGGVAWILHGRPYVAPNLRLSLGLLVVTASAIVMERPPSEYFEVAFDRISIAHLTMSLLALAFWSLVPWAPTARESDSPGELVWSRLVRASVGGVAAVGILLGMHPGFTLGPWAGVDPEMTRFWLEHIPELQPLLPTSMGDVGFFLMTLGHAFLLVPLTAILVIREWRAPMGPVWIYLLLSLLVFVPLAALQVRMTGFAGVIFAILLVELTRRTLLRLEDVKPLSLRRLARVGSMAGLLLLFLVVGGLLDRAAAHSGPGDRFASDGPSSHCEIAPMARVLADEAGPFHEPQTIAAIMNFGPELLYRTHHRVLAGPYHRNEPGIRATYRLLVSGTPEESRQVAEERGVDLILLCPPGDAFYLGRGGEDSLYRHLVSGNLPSWIEVEPLPPSAGDGFLLFRVRHEESG